MPETEDNAAHTPRGKGDVGLSIVVPVHNEAEALPHLFRRLDDVLRAEGISYEIICVDDGSTDNTVEVLKQAGRKDPRIKTLVLSRNFGKEAALTAGLDAARGDAVVPMDADLQDPPEIIPKFLEHWRSGYDVVYAVRSDRGRDAWLKRSSSRGFYRVMHRLAGIEIPDNAGDFRLMDRRVVEAIRGLRERNRFMKGIFAWVGFPAVAVEYARPERVAGTTKFSYWRLWNFAIDGITGFSTLPLRLAGYVGLLVALLSLAYAAWLVVRTLVWGIDVPGYASVMVAVLFIGGVQMIMLGIIGEYLGRVFQETKGRPLYVVADRLGFDRQE